MTNQLQLRSNSKDRILYIDTAKAIGLLLAVMAHCAYTGITHEINYLTSLIRMPVFFLCSGFTTISLISIKSKFRKLIIPYFTINAIYLVFSWLVRGDVNLSNVFGIFYSRFSLYPLGTPDNLFFLDIENGPTWFFTAFFCSFLLLKPILAVKREWQRILMCAAYLAISYMLQFCPILLPWSLDTSLYFAVIMYVGMLIRKHDVLSWPWWTFACILAVYLICLHFNGTINLSVRMYGHYFPLSFVGCVSGSVLLLKFCKLISGLSLQKWVGKVNRNALGIFGLQGIFIYLSIEAVDFTVSCVPELHILQSSYFLVFVQIFSCIIGGCLSGKLLNLTVPFAMGISRKQQSPAA